MKIKLEFDVDTDLTVGEVRDKLRNIVSAAQFPLDDTRATWAASVERRILADLQELTMAKKCPNLQVFSASN